MRTPQQSRKDPKEDKKMNNQIIMKKSKTEEEARAHEARCRKMGFPFWTVVSIDEQDEKIFITRSVESA